MPEVVKAKIKITWSVINSFLKGAGVIFTDLFKDFFIFLLLLFLYLLNIFIIKFIKIPLLPKPLTAKFLILFSRFYFYVTKYLEKNKGAGISRMDLIELSIKNMKAKKIRTLITVGGVSIGMGAIVFLVSLGYGVQKLIISRVARLDELRQADISTQPGGKVKITDSTVNDIKHFQDVSSVLPLIAVVGRVNFNNSISDMAVYGVTTDYLRQSAVKPVQGKIFENNDLVVKVSSAGTRKGQVAGASSERPVYGQKIGEVSFSIAPEEWIRVRNGMTTSSEILGYTRRPEGTQTGDMYWGSSYVTSDDSSAVIKDAQGKPVGKWVKSKVFLWEEADCDTSELDCADGKHVIIRDGSGAQVQKEGYFALINVMTSLTEPASEGQVLGDSSVRTDEDIVDIAALNNEDPSVLAESTENVIEATGSEDWVELVGESSASAQATAKKVPIPDGYPKEAVVNRAMLNVLGIKEYEALGKKFNATFVVTGNLLAEKEQKIESEPADYTIVGVIPDDKSPVFYVPFIDLRVLGVTNYSQLKVVSKSPEVLAKVRTQIESLGFNTQSVADTVEQINTLFNTVRLVLGAMGMIALAVASLGMFNTLTVSLLERTREVGLMKAMGMKSKEIQELFMTESIIMGLAGGMFGLLVGFVLGKLVGIFLTSFAVFKGAGIIDVSFIPFSFVVLIMILSFIVGLVTGLFPSRRAKKISALNALRYE